MTQYTTSILAIIVLLMGSQFTTAEAPRFERLGDGYVGGQDGYHTYRLPALTCTDKGTLLLFCDGRKNSAGDIGKVDPVLRRSLDGGRTWEPLQVLDSDPGEGTKIGNACPLYDRETGAVHLLYLKDLTQALLITSTDEGATFSPPKDITAAFREFDYPWKYFATGHVHGIQLQTGRLVVPVWLNTVPRKSESKGLMRNGILFSDDHGKSWHGGGLIEPFHNLNESSVYEASDGSLAMNCRAAKLGRRVISRSEDGGATWTTPQPEAALPCPTCQASTLVVRSADGGHRVLFANPASEKSRNHLTLRLSDDDGRTWAVSKLVDQGFAGYCDMAAGPDGSVYLAYEGSGKRGYDRVAVVAFNLEWLADTAAGNAHR